MNHTADTPYAESRVPYGARLHKKRIAVLCSVVLATILVVRHEAAAQVYLLAPATENTAQAPAAGPSWEEFHELNARLQAAESRLESMSQRPPVAPPDYTQPSNPYGFVSAPQGGAPADVADLNARLTQLEGSYAADKAQTFPSARLTGFSQLDMGYYGQDATSMTEFGPMQDGIGFRRARLQAVGKLTEFTNYSLEVDFGTGGRPSLVDIWGEQMQLPFVGNVRIGQFRQPTTMDAWTSIKHLEFLERSLPFQALDPFRRVGAMQWWNSEDERTMVASSIYGTGFTLFNPIGGVDVYNTLGSDTQHATQIGNAGGISWAGRMSHLLYLDPYAGERYLLHVGGGYNFSQIGGNSGTGSDARTYRAASLPEFFVGDPAGGGRTIAGTPIFVDTGRILANNYQLAHAELAGNYGPAHFQCEYLATFVDQRTGANMFYDGAYFQTGYFLTGENCGYNKKMGAMDYNVQPFSDFFSLGRDRWFGGWGAWEIAGRWSYLNLANNNLVAANQLSASAGPPPQPNPGVLNNATVAVNWWWNKYTRLQFNYIHAMLNSTNFGRSNTDIYATRFQVEF